MTLQILPRDISASEELRLKSIKRGVCPKDTWAKWAYPLAREQARRSQARQTQPTQPDLCCYLSAIKLCTVIFFSSLSSQDFLRGNEFPARPRESHRLWCTIACVKSSSFLLWKQPHGQNKGRPVHFLYKWLWPGHSQQVTSPSPLCQTQDALLVQHGLESCTFLSTLVASLPSTVWQLVLQGTTHVWYKWNG